LTFDEVDVVAKYDIPDPEADPVGADEGLLSE